MKRLLLLISAGFFSVFGFGQTYNMSNTAVSTCSGTFYDSGGNTNNYASGENFIKTFTPSSAGSMLQFVFTSFSVEGSTYDYLRVYDGPTTASPLIGTYTSNPGTITATNGTGQLTFWFVSDGSLTYSGWSATISCISTYDMTAGPSTINTCSGIFRDPGGASNYPQNATTYNQTFCSNSGNAIQFNFSTFATFEVNDNLQIYDGPNTGSTLIGTYSLASSPGIVTSSTSCLTFVWTTDNDNKLDVGWVANISCVPLPPANDAPCTATVATVNADLACGSVTAGTVAAATNSGISACVGSGADDDVWYRFVATSTVHNFDLLNIAGSSTDMVHEIFSGTCGALSSVGCSDPNTSQFSGFTIGVTYYVRVYTKTAIGGQNTTFNLCIGTPPPPPSNDLCSGTTLLPCGTTNMAGTTVNTVSESTFPTSYASPFGVWYSFVGDGQITTISSVAGSGFDHGIVIMSGSSCGSYTLITDQDGAGSGGTETYTFISTIGITYYVYIAYYGTSGTSTNTGTFTISRSCTAAPPIPINNLCSSPTVLSCGASINGTTAGSTNIPNSTSCTMSNYGVWYTFVGDGQFTTISATGTGTGLNLEMSISTGSCGSLTSVTCRDASSSSTGTETHSFNSISGTTYYVYIAYYLSSGSFSDTGPFTISRTCTAPPTNDLCSSPTNLPCGTTALAGTTVASTNVTHGTGCTLSNYGVWYSFVGDGQVSTISAVGVNLNLEMAIVSGSCGSLSNIACIDNTSSTTGTESYSFLTTIGTTYYIYIAHTTSSSTTTGQFTISRTCTAPPTNTTCASATNLPCGTIGLAGTTAGSSNTTHGTGCTISNYGVWYTFIGDGQITTITTTGVNLNLEMAITTGNCGSLTNIVCRDASSAATGSETYTFLTVLGTRYNVYIAHTTSGSNVTGNFTINRTCTPPPSNTTCATASNLPCGTTFSASTLGTSNIAHGTSCTMSNYGIWYSFTGDGQQTTISITNSYDIELSISSGSCGAFTNIVCTDFPESHTFTTTNGVNYFVYVAYWTTGTTTGTFDITRTCGTPPASGGQDCTGGTSICSDASFSGNSSGPGSVTDLTSATEDCLSGENESSWYFFEAYTGGTLEFGIKPVNGTDDYDFAVWGPYPSGSTPSSICPPSSAPVRCSYAAGAPTNPAVGTGLVSGAGDTSEGTGGDDIVDPIVLTAGQVYILLIDNYSSTTSPFNMDLNLTNGLSLNCNPLPVELISFNGYAEEGYNLLKWTTAVEINNDYFEIEKSIDGVLFHKLAEVGGSGNSNVIKNYEYKELNPYLGITYYRLKQIDYNGTMSYSSIVAVKQTLGAEVSIYPNPTFGRVKMNFVSKDNGIYKVIVSDISKVIYEQSFVVSKGNKIVDLNYFKDLAKGFYIIQIVDENNNTIIKTEKIVKQ